ncbi:MAG TPA: VWA domain-containing protein [Pyrinomonadaceae bacterium]|nr:VWA domain-containing protein [Pyrinomonadaceae bacterium]
MGLERAANLARHARPRRPGLLTTALAPLLAALIFHAPAFAQDTPTPADSGEVERVETNLVTVPVFVTDKRGRRVAGLRVEEFEVRDEGRTVELSFFASGADRVALLFLLDASGSASQTLDAQREAALALFARFGRGSRVAVKHFQETVESTLPFTADPASARDGFRFSSSPNGRTAIFDAALIAARGFGRDAPQATERRIVILISDGLDTASSVPASEAIRAARTANVSFYVIHLPLFAPRDGRLAPRPTAKGFRDLAEDTGGRFFTVGDASDALNPRARPRLDPVFEAIAEDLSGQYLLGYYPPSNERTINRRIEVRLAARARRDLRVRTLRDSYQLQ